MNHSTRLFRVESEDSLFLSRSANVNMDNVGVTVSHVASLSSRLALQLRSSNSSIVVWWPIDSFSPAAPGQVHDWLTKDPLETHENAQVCQNMYDISITQ